MGRHQDGDKQHSFPTRRSSDLEAVETFTTHPLPIAELQISRAIRRWEIGRAHVRTPVTAKSRMPTAASKNIKFNLTIPLQQLHAPETRGISLVVKAYAFLQIAR